MTVSPETCMLSWTNASREYARLLLGANLTYSYIYKWNSRGCIGDLPHTHKQHTSFISDVGMTGTLSFADAHFGFTLLTPCVHRLLFWWILLVTFTKLPLHTCKRILLNILNDPECFLLCKRHLHSICSCSRWYQKVLGQFSYLVVHVASLWNEWVLYY
jgi:hypothetical protein